MTKPLLDLLVLVHDATNEPGAADHRLSADTIATLHGSSVDVVEPMLTSLVLGRLVERSAELVPGYAVTVDGRRWSWHHKSRRSKHARVE